MNFRNFTKPSDIESVKEILLSTGFFYDFEIEVAIEVLEENLKKGETKSGYSFLFAEDDSGKAVGFTCWGEIPCTQKRYDLYWIAVSDELRGQGLGKELLKKTENYIKEKEGKIIYIETSSRDIYIPTRTFYEKCGYIQEAFLKDFYAENDGKCIFSKRLF